MVLSVALLRVVTTFFQETFSVSTFWGWMSLHLVCRHVTQCYTAYQDRRSCNTNENRNMMLTSVFHFVPLLRNSKTVTVEMTLTRGNSVKHCTVTCCYVFFRETFSVSTFWGWMSLHLDDVGCVWRSGCVGECWMSVVRMCVTLCCMYDTHTLAVSRQLCVL